MVHRGQRHYVIYRDVQALSVEVPSMPCSALAEASHLQQRSLSAQSSSCRNSASAEVMIVGGMCDELVSTASGSAKSLSLMASQT